MPAYWNKMLEVDLSKKEVKEIALDEKTQREFIGGSGIGAKLFFDRFDPSVKPLDPANPLIIMAGPLTGSSLPGSMTRFGVVSRSPLTDLFCESSCGGTFGHVFKTCGFDGIIITGASDAPVYIEISDDSCVIKDASALWGKDTYETSEALEKIAKEAGGRKPAVFTIGQAGENLVKYANIMNGHGNYAGRGGFGAVMGSKKLKAIVARGSKKIAFADPVKLSELKKALLAKIEENIAVQSIKAFGTNGSVDLGSMTGDVPMKHWGIGSWDEGIDKINGPTLTDTILTGTHACLGCPVGCKRIVTVEGGPFAMEKTAGPEYETVGAFGSMMLIPDLAAISKINEICNRYGMDTITCGGTISLMIVMLENGLISLDELDGIELKWGDPDPVIKVIHLIAKREGVGDLLAEGSRKVSHRLGKGAEFLADVKGMEAPMHDPRAYWGMALNYAVGSRGACHVNTAQMFHEQGFFFFPEIGLGETVDQFTTEHKAMLNIKTQAIGAILNAACTCHFPSIPFTIDDYLDMLNLATGFGYTVETFMEAGDRMWLLKRGLNNLYGTTRADDCLTPRMLAPLEDGPTAGVAIELEPMLEDFYKLRDIDDQGRPSKTVLEKAGLDALATRLFA